MGFPERDPLFPSFRSRPRGRAGRKGAPWRREGSRAARVRAAEPAAAPAPPAARTPARGPPAFRRLTGREPAAPSSHPGFLFL